MTSDHHTPAEKPDLVLHRGDDRRRAENLATPPYLTNEGMVLVDRRSYLERRACWIRHFRLEPNGLEH